MQMNPMQLLGMIKSANNPQQFMMSMLQSQAGNNPMLNNVLNMARQNDAAGIERVARNLAKERGVNPEQVIQQIKSQLGML